jgi:hypothetical protein
VEDYRIWHEMMVKAEKNTSDFLSRNMPINEKLTIIQSLCHHISYSIPLISNIKISKDHKNPRLTAISNELSLILPECNIEGEFALFFLINGQYRDFYFHLRCLLELILSLIYFSTNEDEDLLLKWFKGECKTPTPSQCKGKIFSLNKIQNFNVEFLKTWDSINDLIHHKGESSFQIEQNSSNSFYFVETRFIEAFKKLMQVFEIVYTVLVCINPILLLEFQFSKKLGQRFHFGYFSPDLVSQRSLIIRKDWLLTIEKLTQIEAIKELQSFLNQFPDYIDDNNDYLEDLYNGFIVRINAIIVESINTN